MATRLLQATSEATLRDSLKYCTLKMSGRVPTLDYGSDDVTIGDFDYFWIRKVEAFVDLIEQQNIPNYKDPLLPYVCGEFRGSKVNGEYIGSRDTFFGFKVLTNGTITVTGYIDGSNYGCQGGDAGGLASSNLSALPVDWMPGQGPYKSYNSGAYLPKKTYEEDTGTKPLYRESADPLNQIRPSSARSLVPSKTYRQLVYPGGGGAGGRGQNTAAGAAGGGYLMLFGYGGITITSTGRIDLRSRLLAMDGTRPNTALIKTGGGTTGAHSYTHTTPAPDFQGEDWFHPVYRSNYIDVGLPIGECEAKAGPADYGSGSVAGVEYSSGQPDKNLRRHGTSKTGDHLGGGTDNKITYSVGFSNRAETPFTFNTIIDINRYEDLEEENEGVDDNKKSNGMFLYNTERNQGSVVQPWRTRGGGGGLCLVSNGPISFDPTKNITLRSRYHDHESKVHNFDGPNNSGTLKIFHGGQVPDGVFKNNNPLEYRAHETIKQWIGGFYAESMYDGWCLDRSTLTVTPLVSQRDIFKDSDNTKLSFTLSFSDASAYLPTANYELQHLGFDVYRFIGTKFNTSHTYSKRLYDAEYDNNIRTPDMFEKDENGNEITRWVKVASIPSKITMPLVIRDYNSHEWAYLKEPDVDDEGYYRKGTPPSYTFTDNIDITSTADARRLYYESINNTRIKKYVTEDVLRDIMNTKRRVYYAIIPKIKFMKEANLVKYPCIAKIHPRKTLPTFSSVIFAYPIRQDEYSGVSSPITGRLSGSDTRHDILYYSRQAYPQRKYSTGKRVASGFDDLYIDVDVTSYVGSFDVPEYRIYWDENNTNNSYYLRKYNKDYFDDSIKLSSAYTYLYPTQKGRDKSFTNNQFIKTNGMHTIVLTSGYNFDAYTEDYVSPAVPITGFMQSSTAFVFEREPTPLIVHNPTYTNGFLSSPTLSAYWSDFILTHNAAGDNGVSKYSITLSSSPSTYPRYLIHNRVLSGYENSLVLSVSDQSISRTYETTANAFYTDLTNSAITAEYTNQSIDRQLNEYKTELVYTSAGVYFNVYNVRAAASNTGHDLSSVHMIKVYPMVPSAEMETDFDATTGYVPLVVDLTGNILGSPGTLLSYASWEIYDTQGSRNGVTSVTSEIAGTVTTTAHNWNWHTDYFTGSPATVNRDAINACLLVGTSSFGVRENTYSQGLTSLFASQYTPLSSTGRDCEHIRLYEKPPFASIEFLTATTVGSSYTDDNPTYELSSCVGYIDGDYYCVSGYAPHLNITLVDSSSPKSYPITSYEWNFKDYYGENDYYSVVSSTTAIAEFKTYGGAAYTYPANHGVDGMDDYPTWRTDMTNNTASHLYTLPGEYYTTLTVKASTTSTPSTSTIKVIVLEKLPTCGLEESLSAYGFSNVVASGASPLTVYFTPTSISAGTYPILQIVWDFGDGTDLFVVDRYENNYENSPFGSDPRYYNDGVVSHEYVRTLSEQPSSFTVTLSVVSELTNSYITCSGSGWVDGNAQPVTEYNVGPVVLPTMDIDGMRLIKNRSFGDDKEFLVLQDSDTKSIHNILVDYNE